MKKIYQIAFIICFLQIGFAQGKFDESVIENKISSNFNINEKAHLKCVGTKEYLYSSEHSTANPIKDSLHGIYGDLLNDDPDYNPKAAWWKPAIQVIGINLFVYSIDRYIFKYSWSTTVGLDSWNHNIKTGWVWDDDRFGMNFLAHPYTGSLYFTSARAQGYGYFGSFPYAVEGSLLWEYCGKILCLLTMIL